MRLAYDRNGNCTTCGLPGTGFISEGVCLCLDQDIVLSGQPSKQQTTGCKPKISGITPSRL